MSSSSRYLAFLAYLLSLPGALFVLLARRDDTFAVFHARQSLAIALAALMTPLIWVVCAWALAWIPLAGALIAVALFALVLAVYFGLAVCWIIGMIFALQGKVRSVPVVGAWARRRSAARPASVPEPALQESSPELVERTSSSDV